jgi:hypothetical protein
MKEFDFTNEKLPEKLAEIQRRTSSLSIFRIISFLGLIGFFVLGVSESLVWFVLFFTTGAGFVYLVSVYNHLKDQEAIYSSLEKMDSNRKLRVVRNLKSFEQGVEFQSKHHPFSNDLDLFGDHSLFQLINHTVSKEGKIKLSKLIVSEFDINKAAIYRASVDELSTKPAFLHAMESIGLAFYRDEKSIHAWMNWMKENEQIKSWIMPFVWIGPIGGVILTILAYLEVIPSGFYGIWVLIGTGLLAAVFRSLKKAGEEIPSRNQLKTYRYWLIEIEKQEFLSEGLRNAAGGFCEANSKASELLEELDRLGLWIQNRLNFLYFPINLFFWTDLLLYVRLQKWKSKYGNLVSEFPEQLANWEMLVSLGTFQYELGGKGEIIEVASGIKGLEIVHPLLSSEIAVSNDFAQNSDMSIILLTGSNMSGKTTFMRTLGINCVLVNLGLRPFAKEFGFGNFQLYTSMRNTDNLGESVSSFYAELSRIKLLIDRIEVGEEIFFLLDEILKGTNTEDRISGSEALIRQVVATKAIGIISTHDIELADLENRIETVRNFSFHSEIHDQSIDFDYKLKTGACLSFNAHKLMELMGIRFQN